MHLVMDVSPLTVSPARYESLGRVFDLAHPPLGVIRAEQRLGAGALALPSLAFAEEQAVAEEELHRRRGHAAREVLRLANEYLADVLRVAQNDGPERSKTHARDVARARAALEEHEAVVEEPPEIPQPRHLPHRPRQHG